MRISFLEAKEALEKGRVVGVPTETVYGLAASLHCPSAIEHIFGLKGRPRMNPLIVHVSDVCELDNYVSEYPPDFHKIAEAFWPGPLTCILPVNSTIPSIVTAGLTTAGFRIPGLSITRKLIAEVGPLVMPSANISGKPSATRVEHVEEDFGENFPVLEGDVCERGLESTIIIFDEERWSIIRQGALPQGAFVPLLGYAPEIVVLKSNKKVLCPGQLFRHYSPQAKLLLDLGDWKEGGNVLGFMERDYAFAGSVFVLGSLLDAAGVAENLYEVLRRLDREGKEEAWVDMDFPWDGVWMTIRERLLRAASSG
jgi:L-threonylcarbamoyladenylate synthase